MPFLLKQMTVKVSRHLSG